MRTLISVATLALLLFGLLSARPDVTVTVGRGAAAAAPTYLIKQGFETTGYDNSESWSAVGGGAADPDYTGAPVEASQSGRINTSAQADIYFESPAFAAQSECWMYFQVKPEAFDSGNAVYFAALFGGGAERLWIRKNSDATMRIDHGSVNASTVDTIDNTKTNHVWVRYKTGTGANGQADLWFSFDTTRPASGNKTCSITTGTETTTVTKCRMGNLGGFSRTVGLVYDHVRVDDVNIGSAPE